MDKKTLDPQCGAYQKAIDVIARPWSGLILGLLASGPLRFREIEERAHGLGAKTLSARLKDLESRGLIEREVEAGPPIRVRYELTASGKSFGTVAEAIQSWGAELVAAEAKLKPSPSGPLRKHAAKRR